jgi:hypothetical protein
VNWFRWYYGTYSDPKFAVVAKRCGQPKHVVLAVWAALLETAGNATKRGDVSSFDPETIGLALDLEPDVVMAVFTAFMAKELVTKDRQISAWDKRQHYDYSTERVRKYRSQRSADKIEQEPVETHDETPRNDVKRSETQETPDQIRSEQIREDTETAPQGGADDEQPRKPDGKRGTRLAPDWQPSAEDIEFAQQSGLDNAAIAHAAAEFRDYWTAVPGAKGCKLDWSATWRNRVRDIVARPAGRRSGRESAGVVETYAGVARSLATRTAN